MHTDSTDETVLTVAGARLKPLKRLAEASGIALEPILRRHSIPPSALDPETSVRVRLSDYYRVLQGLSLEFQDETCHLSSRPLMPGSSHFIWSHVDGAANLYEAMRRVASAYNLLHGGNYNHVEMDARSLRYLIDDRSFPYVSPSDEEHIVFSLECVLIFLHCMLAMISGDALNGMLQRVYSRRTRTGDGHHLRFLGVVVRRSHRHYGLIYAPQAAWLPVRADSARLPRHEAVYERIIERIERDPSGNRARPRNADRVRALLRAGLDTQPAVAARLGLSVASLRRRLAGEGCSFRALRAETLHRAAEDLLRQGKRPGEVAELLGYSDTRSFSRAFKRLSQLTPAGYLRRHQGRGRISERRARTG